MNSYEVRLTLDARRSTLDAKTRSERMISLDHQKSACFAQLNFVTSHANSSHTIAGIDWLRLRLLAEIFDRRFRDVDSTNRPTPS